MIWDLSPALNQSNTDTLKTLVSPLGARAKRLTMGTFSKALGSLGGFISGAEEIRDYLQNKARTLFYSTALPPAVCASVLSALDIIINQPDIRNKLKYNITYFKAGLLKSGLTSQPFPVPIFPIIIGKEEKTLAMSKALEEKGIFIPAIRPPTVPRNESRLRISLMAGHTREHLDYFLHIIKISF